MVFNFVKLMRLLVTKDDLSFKSVSRSVNELVVATVVKIMMVKRRTRLVSFILV